VDADGLRARDLLNHHHDGWSQHGPCRLVRQTIDITVDLSTLVVRYGTLCHRQRRYYCDIVTRVLLDCSSNVLWLRIEPPDAAHTVGNGALQVSRTISGISESTCPRLGRLVGSYPETRSLSDTAIPPGTVPVHRAPSPERLVHMHLLSKRATNAMHGIV
jgi:hypothetical protein